MKLIIITGPTACGKTLLGINLAKALNGEVVSADSMQIYKYMNIGTAKPTADEMDGVVHHMIDIIPPWEDYSVAQYVKKASSCIDEILKRNKQPIIVGGSGLYIDSLIRGRIFASRGDEKLRQELEAQYDKLGGKIMLERLRALDEKRAALLHENDKKRIVRALEVIETSGQLLSAHDIEEREQPARYNARKFILNYSDRSVLYDKINRRVDNMVSRGLVNEVASLLARGVPRSGTSMQAIGYKEIAAALENDTDMNAAVSKVKMESTRYAKRQITWLKRDKKAHTIIWHNLPDIEYGIAKIKEMLD